MWPILVAGVVIGALVNACQSEHSSEDNPETSNSLGKFVPSLKTPSSSKPPTASPTKYSASLAGRAILPYESRLTTPPDLPKAMGLAGKFTNPNQSIMSSPGLFRASSFISDKSAPRYTGIKFPIQGQPLQGFSGIQSLGDGTFIATLDNGFGSKANSKDALLGFIKFKIHWKSGKVEVLEESFLHDPDKILPFEIVNDASSKRYLTGSDLDPESIQVLGAEVFIGEEFGPFLLRTDHSGKITGLFQPLMGKQIVRSKGDNPLPDPGNTLQLFKSSRGFEGMAATPDEKYLFPLLEGPLVDPKTGKPETLDGKPVLRILKFDLAKRRFTGESFQFPLEQEGNNIGDFNFISEHEALVVERDWGEGEMSQACGEQVTSSCFNKPAKFKRVYKISFKGVPAGNPVRKLGYIDLLDIQDGDKRFTFPFVTIENVDRVDGERLIVANDNNYGYSAGRNLGVNDDSEFILLEAPELLRESQ